MGISTKLSQTWTPMLCTAVQGLPVFLFILVLFFVVHTFVYINNNEIYKYIYLKKNKWCIYLYLVCGLMLCMAVQGLSFFCNIYECIYCRKKISLVLPCKALAHKPSMSQEERKMTLLFWCPPLLIGKGAEGPGAHFSLIIYKLKLLKNNKIYRRHN